MNFVRKTIPHAMILIANMYYVFFGIDRVNKAMNFIDNGITKTLLALMCLMIGATAIGLFFGSDAHNREIETGRKVLNAIAVILGAVYLLLYLIDLFLGGESGLMLKEMIKLMILLLCLCTSAAAILKVAYQRRMERQRYARASRRANDRAIAAQNNRDYSSNYPRMTEKRAQTGSYGSDTGTAAVRGRHSGEIRGRHRDFEGDRVYRSAYEHRGAVRSQGRGEEYAQPRSNRTGEAGVRTRSDRLNTERAYRTGNSGNSRAYRSDYERSARIGSGAERIQRSSVLQGYSQRSVRTERRDYAQYDRQRKITR